MSLGGIGRRLVCLRCEETMPHDQYEAHEAQCRLDNPDCVLCLAPVREDEVLIEPPTHEKCFIEEVIVEQTG